MMLCNVAAVYDSGWLCKKQVKSRDLKAKLTSAFPQAFSSQATSLEVMVFEGGCGICDVLKDGDAQVVE